MIFLQLPQLIPFCAALVFTLTGACFRRDLLSYLGGFFWALASVLAMIRGASLTEVLSFTLLLLLCSFLRRKEEQDEL